MNSSKKVLSSTKSFATLPVENAVIKKQTSGIFQKHTSVLMWKSYLQRQRRWRLLVIETSFGAVLFLLAIFIAKPVFLTPLEAEPESPLTASDMLASLRSNTIIGYAPNGENFTNVMIKAASLLQTTLLDASSEEGLNMILYKKSQGTPLKQPIIWVIWSETENKKWKFSIRSTDRARFVSGTQESQQYTNQHLRAGFLAVQVAISQAILEVETDDPPQYEVSLVAMPVSPLMQEDRVKRALSLILMCFTLALLPAVLETEALVVWETQNMFKRALRMRSVGYSCMYLSWIVYAYLTALPVCMLGAITIILTFRWIHLITALLILLSYVTVMTMVALIMAMYHRKPHIACIWTTLFTLLQTYLAELLVHHHYDTMHVGLTFLLNVVLPPLGLINAFNEFALLSTVSDTSAEKLLYMVASWGLLIVFYYILLMILQRTVRHGAIGGQVSWSSIIFKQAENRDELRRISMPSFGDSGKLQEVDEFLAKAISFRNVSKTIMGIPIIKQLSFDIYRCEYTIFFVGKLQEKSLDDMITGLALPDKGEIVVQGEVLTHDSEPLNTLYMVGYCHRSETLIDDLTVQEHFTFFTAICLWHQPQSVINEYGTIRYHDLIKECNLREVRYTRVRDLDIYYKAQLCWALARLLEPRVIIIPCFTDEPIYRAVIKDKIMRFRNDLTVIAFYKSCLHLQYADRIFVFDSQLLVFGGTPAYMFFRYGREYQVRLNLRTTNVDEEKDESDEALLERAQEAGASVRAHLGSLLILRLPAIPTAPVAAFIKDLTDNAEKYGVIPSLINISVPDFDEVVKRAIDDTKPVPCAAHDPQAENEKVKAALKVISEPNVWERSTFLNMHFGQILHKFIQFHFHHKTFLLLTFLFAMVTGLLLGLSVSSVLVDMVANKASHTIYKSEPLTVESLETHTNLVVRADSTSESAMSIAHAYVMSETNSSLKQVKNMVYVALPHTESFTEYLVTRAVDSPQRYVYEYAYGMDVGVVDESIKIQALYSPLHRDKAAAARSLARVYMALLRHYTEELDASIQVYDEPLSLDLTVWVKDLSQPPLFLQFLLILTISHITLLPSMEYGLIRHVQKHALNFSPARYWFTLYLCDVLFFCILIGLMSTMMIAVMYYLIPQSILEIYDLLILPLMLLVYGAGCVPQAYVFSLGPQIALNAMSFIIVNMVFGETTIVAKLFYGDTLYYILDVMTLSPQFNMAYAYVKIKQIFIYNTECVIFRAQNLCPTHTMHKCCERCGVLQECFKRKDYFTRQGILMEMIAMGSTFVFFTTLLFLIEYGILTLIWKTISNILYDQDIYTGKRMSGADREVREVMDKHQSISAKGKKGPQLMRDTFGEYLCASNLSRRQFGLYYVRSVYLGLGRGEAISIIGLKRHGRKALCQILAGLRIPCEGTVLAMSKWKLTQQKHMYCRQVSFGCKYRSLPPWLTVKDALVLIASLRGVPKKYVEKETKAFIDALDLSHLSNTRIQKLNHFEGIRLQFTAAVVGAPPIIVLDEFTLGQKISVVRVMYSILHYLRKKGHAIVSGSTNVESQRAITNRLAIMLDGTIYDVDSVDKLISRHSPMGYTVVVHINDEVDGTRMFAPYFKDFIINDSFEVLINAQIRDSDLTWKSIFAKMEVLQAENHEVDSYIITDITIDYIFHSILTKEKYLHPATGFFSWGWAKKILSSKPKKEPPESDLDKLQAFEQHYEITSLKGLPWSAIFHSSSDVIPAQERLMRTSISSVSHL